MSPGGVGAHWRDLQGLQRDLGHNSRDLAVIQRVLDCTGRPAVLSRVPGGAEIPIRHPRANWGAFGK